MLDTPLELPNIPAPVLTRKYSTPMALPIRPLSSINITSEESINPNPMPYPLPILSTIPASSCPSLHTITIILLIYPITFIPPTHMIVINPTSWTLSSIKFTLINILITINLHPRPRIWPFLQFWLRPNWPKNRLRGLRDARRWTKLNWQRAGKKQANWNKTRKCNIQGNQKGCRESDYREEIKKERPARTCDEVKGRHRKEDKQATVDSEQMGTAEMAKKFDSQWSRGKGNDCKWSRTQKWMWRRRRAWIQRTLVVVVVVVVKRGECRRVGKTGRCLVHFRPFVGRWAKGMWWQEKLGDGFLMEFELGGILVRLCWWVWWWWVMSLFGLLRNDQVGSLVTTCVGQIGYPGVSR